MIALFNRQQGAGAQHSLDLTSEATITGLWAELDELEKTIEEGVLDLENMVKADLEKLQRQISSGLQIDRSYIQSRDPSSLLFECINELPQAKKEDCTAQYQAIINRAYIERLIQELDAGRLPECGPLEAFLHGLRYTPEQTGELVERMKRPLREALQEHITKAANTKPLDMVGLIQKAQLQIGSQCLQLGSRTQEEIEDILDLIADYEKTLESARQALSAQFEERIEAVLAKRVLSGPEKEARRKVLKKRIWQPLTPLLNRITDLLTSEAQSFATLTYEQYLEVAVAMGDRTVEPSPSTVVAQHINRRLERSLVEGLTGAQPSRWIAEQGSHCRFRYSQDAWGEQAMSNEGVCAAINYRWARAQLAEVDKPIRQAEDLVFALSPSDARKREIIPDATKGLLSPEDRFVQASMGIALERRELSGNLDMPLRVKKKHKVQYRSIISREESRPDIRSLIDAVLASGVDLEDSAGIVLIASHGKHPDGTSWHHALGMRIDPRRDRYAFWDVNNGFFEYSSQEEMIRAFESYIDLDPNGLEFINFHAAQFIPQPPPA